MKFWKSSLLVQLVSYFSLLSVVTVSIVAIAAYTRGRYALRNSITDRLTVATSLKEYQLGEWVSIQTQDILLMSQLPDIQKEVALILTQNPAQSRPAYQRLNKIVSDILVVKPSMHGINITDNGGYVLFSTDKTREGGYAPIAAPTTYFTKEGIDTFVPNFYTSRVTKKSAITFATPLIDQQGTRMGAITIDLDLKGVDQLIREKTGLGESGETYLIGRSNAKNAFMSSTSTKSQPANSLGIDQAIDKNDGVGEYKNYAGVEVIGVYRWLTKQNLALLAEMSQDEAFAPARQLAKDILLIGLSSASLLLVGVYLLARRITQPIMGITDAALQVSKGNLNSMAPVLTEDEIGILARAFNQMTSQLKLSGQQLGEYSRTLEQKVNQRTGELKAIIDNMVDGLVVIDRDDQITQFNPALIQLFGLTYEEMLFAKSKDLLPLQEIENLISNTREYAKQVFTTEFNLPNSRCGKAVATAIFQADPVTGDVYVGTVILIRDITVEKEVDRMKTDFVSSVSHELRTPLTSVLGFAKLIQKKLNDNLFPLIVSDDKKVQRSIRQVGENIEIIVSEGERLTRLINEVLDIAKMEAGKIDWKMELITMEEIVDRALSATSSLFDNKGLQAIKDIESTLPKIMGDQDRLIQVMINLISNAVKFQETGSVTCAVRHEGDNLTVSVIDQGIGIAVEDLPKVFEKFRQVGDTLTKKPKGTGLGLPISKEIVEHHGGKIWLESELDKGTTFFFTIPIARNYPH
jgi:PAS domain S-box-containing protein